MKALEHPGWLCHILAMGNRPTKVPESSRFDYFIYNLAIPVIGD